MYPVLYELGPIKLHTYGLMIAIGFLSALHLSMREYRQRGWDEDRILFHAFWGLLLGVAGTRLLHIILYPENYSWSDPVGWIALWRGGLVFQGCLPVIFIYTYFGFKKLGVPYWAGMDIAIAYVPLAQAFGRVGCFFYGCCFGMRGDDLPWAIQFPKGSPAYNAHLSRFADFSHTAPASCPVHPTQLYSVAGLLAILALILALRWKWHPFDGFVVALYAMLYGMLRFVLEMYRADENPTGLTGGVLTDQQVFCVVMFLCGAALFLWRRVRVKRAKTATPE
jgi:phosphatidylglycerol---prolipoprotein diacylglyceryl transferase